VPTSKTEALPLPGATTHGGLEATPEELRAAVEDAVGVLREDAIPFLFVGGIAAGLLGRGRYTGDIDLFVRPEDARRTLSALERAGFETSELNPYWIFKGVRGQVLVDILFTLKGDIRLDDEMLARAPVRSFLGVDIPLLPPEDLIVVKAIVFDEETPRHWYDALGMSHEFEGDGPGMGQGQLRQLLQHGHVALRPARGEGWSGGRGNVLSGGFRHGTKSELIATG